MVVRWRECALETLARFPHDTCHSAALKCAVCGHNSFAFCHRHRRRLFSHRLSSLLIVVAAGLLQVAVLLLLFLLQFTTRSACMLTFRSIEIDNNREPRRFACIENQADRTLRKINCVAIVRRKSYGHTHTHTLTHADQMLVDLINNFQ